MENPTGMAVTQAHSPSAIGIRNFSGIHFDPAAPVNAPAVPAATPAAPPAVPASPAAVSPAAAPAGPPAETQEQINWREFRQKHEALETEHAKWKQLGKYEDVSALNQTFSQKLTQAMTMGKALGYTEESIRTAMMDDPKGILGRLQQEYAQPATTSREEMARMLKDHVAQEVKPIQERFDQTINAEAESRYDAERDRLYKAEFADGLPEANKEELFEILDSLVSQDADALRRLKFERQTSDVKKHMEQAKTIFLKRHNEYIAHERGKGQQPPKNGKPPKDEQTGRFMDRKLSDGRLVKDVLNF